MKTVSRKCKAALLENVKGRRIRKDFESSHLVCNCGHLRGSICLLVKNARLRIASAATLKIMRIGKRFR
jgi:homospermidine synthase